jgi:hypothetical protein
MNEFQQRCRTAVERVLRDHGHETGFESPDGSYLYGLVLSEGEPIEIYVYADGAGVKLARQWFVLESREYPSPEALIRASCVFLDGCLSGEHPVDAMRKAR